MTIFDHLLAVLLLLVFPAMSAWDVPRLATRLAADPLHGRAKFYLGNMAILWGVTIALIAAWRWVGRPSRDLGLQLPDGAAAWWWTILICGAAIAVLIQQAYAAIKSPQARDQTKAQLAAQPVLRTLMPSTPLEARLFCGVALTAGFCEEVLYRGFLLSYFEALVPGVAAIVAAVLAFGVAHWYQGLRGVLATGMAGAAAMTVFLLTGSLLAPILLHAVLDLVNGFVIYSVLREAPTA